MNDFVPPELSREEAEVFAVMFHLPPTRLGFIELVRVAVALGARAPGALENGLHGPVRPLDGSEAAANRFRGR